MFSCYLDGCGAAGTPAGHPLSNALEGPRWLADDPWPHRSGFVPRRHRLGLQGHPGIALGSFYILGYHIEAQ